MRDLRRSAVRARLSSGRLFLRSTLLAERCALPANGAGSPFRAFTSLMAVVRSVVLFLPNTLRTVGRGAVDDGTAGFAPISPFSSFSSFARTLETVLTGGDEGGGSVAPFAPASDGGGLGNLLSFGCAAESVGLVASSCAVGWNGSAACSSAAACVGVPATAASSTSMSSGMRAWAGDESLVSCRCTRWQRTGAGPCASSTTLHGQCAGQFAGLLGGKLRQQLLLHPLGQGGRYAGQRFQIALRQSQLRQIEIAQIEIFLARARVAQVTITAAGHRRGQWLMAVPVAIGAECAGYAAFVIVAARSTTTTTTTGTAGEADVATVTTGRPASTVRTLQNRI
uniref:Uncharacterized protein n=1 Tax=Anopheles coluzzii TaxID=1518534 RepID=A0A8W7PPX6_ANOCL